MLRSLILLTVLTLTTCTALWYLFANHYPFVLASEAARRSLEVSTEQLAELGAAKRASDMIGFGLLGATISIVSAVSGRGAQTSRATLLGIFAGALLGSTAGAAAGWLGHWFENSIDLQIDAMMYWAIRWIVVLVPISLAAGLSTAIAGRFYQDIANCCIGAVIGALTSAIVYAVLSGLVTTIESRAAIMPAFNDNRLLVFVCSTFCIGLGVILQNGRQNPNPNATEIA